MNAVRGLFAELGVPLPELETWHTGDVEVFGFPVDLAESQQMWRRVRAVFDRSGMWPFLSSLPPRDCQHQVARDAVTRPYLEQVLRLDPERVIAETIQAERAFFGYDMESGEDDLYDLDQVVADLGAAPIVPTAPKHSFATHYSASREFWLYLVRVDAGYEVPALISAPSWSGWPGADDESPHVALHDVAFLRSWQDRFGAELQSLSWNRLELVVDRPPREMADIARVAIEQYAYCYDLVQIVGEPAQLARKQVPGQRWYFWWD